MQNVPPSAERKTLRTRFGSAYVENRLQAEARYSSSLAMGRHPGLILDHIDIFSSLLRAGLRVGGLWKRGQKNFLQATIQHTQLRVNALPPGFNGWKILHLSDLHLDIAPHLTSALIERLRGLEYDICVLTGDYRGRGQGPYQPCMEELARLRQVLTSPVFAILGNHDCLDMLPLIEKMDIQCLVNEHHILQRNGDRLCLAGVDDIHYYRLADLDKTLNGVPTAVPILLLSHSPVLYREAAAHQTALLLSGHTHGGQICLPGGHALVVNAAIPRNMVAGIWEYNGMRGYTSVGAGGSGLPVRFFCPPEIAIHELTPG